MGDAGSLRPVWAEIDLDAVRSNVEAIRAHVAPSAVLAVVKADAYGHGAVEVGRAALEAGATWLGVALVEEGVLLRGAGVAAPILVLSEPAPPAAAAVVAAGLTPAVYTPAGIEALAKAVASSGADGPLDVHLKVDTGMHRVGCAASESVSLAMLIAQHRELRLAGVCTHLAVADEGANPYTATQLSIFDAVVADLAASGHGRLLLHAANTAGALAHPESRYDMVRIGIGLYGVPPAPDLAGIVPLRAAMAVKARVAHVKHLPAGARLSYGLRYELGRDSRVATVPIGYADGVPRNLGHAGGEVLIRGTRCAIAGTVTMDQLMVDVGDLPVEPGEEVVVLGTQVDEQVGAEEWAALLGTIPYEIVCGIGPRVPRRYLGRRA